jgi:hypothetical protein
MRVDEGFAGTANAPIFDNMWLSVNPAGKTKMEIEDAIREFKGTMTRIANHFKLEQRAPAGNDEDSIKAWGRQFTGKKISIWVSVNKGGKRMYKGEMREFDDQNRVVWRSIAHPDAPVIDKKTGTPTGESYGQRTTREIAEGDAKASGAAARGRTAGGLGESKPSNFF